MLLRGRFYLALLFAVTSLVACDPYLRSTAIDVRDPEKVHYTTTQGLDVGSTPTTIAQHDVLGRGNRFSELIVTATTTPDGRLITSWRVDPDPLHAPDDLTSEKRSSFGHDGLLALGDHVPITHSDRALSFPVCGRYEDFGHTSHLQGGAERFAMRMGVSCDTPHDIELVASTEPSNVRAVRYVSKNEVGRNVILALVSSVVTGAAGTTLLLARDRQDHPLSPAWRGVGIGALAMGATVDLAVLIPAIVSRDHEETIYENDDACALASRAPHYSMQSQ